MKRYILSMVLLSGVASVATAQQVMTASLYDMHGNLHNPAITGSAKHAVIGASYRSMWEGIDGGPQTTVVFGSGYLANSQIGLGGYLYNDVTGPTRRTGVQASFAYHIAVNENTSFSLGLEAKFQQYSLDKAKLQDALGSDPVMGSAENRVNGDAGFGIALTNKKFQVGISASQLIQSKLDFYSGNLTRSEEGRLYRHYYLHGNYNWQVDANTKVIPNLLMIYVPSAPLEVQGGVRVEHRELFWYGLSMRARQSWMLSAGVKVQKKFTIGYCFDIYSTPLSVYDRGSNGHEVMLKYEFLK